MDREEFLRSGLIESYVLGIATEEEKAEVERHARRYPEMRAMIDEKRQALEQYVHLYSATPPYSLKSRILESIDFVEEASRSISRQGVARTALNTVGALVILFLCVICFSMYMKNEKLEDQLTSIRSRYAHTGAQLESSEQDIQEVTAMNSFLLDEDNEIIHLEGTELSPNSHAIVFWNADEETAYLHIDELPAAPPGKTYHLWADANGEMVHLATIKAGKETMIAIPFMAGAQSLNLTLESEGVVEQPTIEQIIIKGKV